MRTKRTFAVIITYGINWYGDNSRVIRVFFAKNTADGEGEANFYYRHGNKGEISPSSVRRILALTPKLQYDYCIINGPRDKDNPITNFDSHPTVDVSFDVPSK